MEWVIVPIVALLASILTLYSGFGLGTLLLPAFALFFPPELAVAATAVVHGANNVFKAATVGRHAEWPLVLRFGAPAMVAALAGAWLLGRVSGFEPLVTYHLGSHVAAVTPLKLLMAALMAGFAVLELHPRFEHLEFERRWLLVGGLASGFFGGLSGHQGALRSAFLAKAGVEPRALVGTNAWLGLLVDLTRLSAYAALIVGARGGSLFDEGRGAVIGVGCVAAFAGVLLGKRWLGKVTLRGVQRVTGGLLLVVAALLASGLA